MQGDKVCHYDLLIRFQKLNNTQQSGFLKGAEIHAEKGGLYSTFNSPAFFEEMLLEELKSMRRSHANQKNTICYWRFCAGKKSFRPLSSPYDGDLAYNEGQDLSLWEWRFCMKTSEVYFFSRSTSKWTRSDFLKECSGDLAWEELSFEDRFWDLQFGEI